MPRHVQSGASVDIGGRGKGANTSPLSTEEARVFQLIADAIHLGHIKYRTCVPLYFVSTVDVGRQKLFMGGLRRTGYLISPTPPRSQYRQGFLPTTLRLSVGQEAHPTLCRLGLGQVLLNWGWGRSLPCSTVLRHVLGRS